MHDMDIPEIMMMGDRETGEACFDLETGEMNMSGPVIMHWNIETLDAETGELKSESCGSYDKKVFQVPRSVLRDSRRLRRRSKSWGRPRVTIVSATHGEDTAMGMDGFFKRFYAICLPVLILLMFLPAWMASLCFTAEFLLHGIAHRTNKIGCFRLYDPLCYATSSFCNSCQLQRTADKVIRIQDRRKLHAINKKLEYLSYVNKIIS